MSPGLCIQCASFDSWYVKGVPNRAPNCPKSHAALVFGRGTRAGAAGVGLCIGLPMLGTFTTLHLHTEKNRDRTPDHKKALTVNICKSLILMVDPLGLEPRTDRL